MGAWKDHGSATGGYYKCNLYEDKKKDSKFGKEENAREAAKNELARYMWHYERYANHENAAKLAVKQMPVMKGKMQMLHDVKSYPPAELEFIELGCQAVIKCREILKWTYVYGFYHDRNLEVNRKALF